MPVPGPIDPRKVPRNALCPCGSGKKFKKCCLRMLEDMAPLVRAEEEKARWAQFEAPPSISTIFKGKRVRALGSKVLFREPSETFHEFLIALLLSTLGKKWHDEQAQAEPAQRHVVWGWTQEWRDLGVRTRPADHPANQPHSAAPTGPAQAVVSLAEDLYRVQQQLGKLPKRLRERLRLHEQFQGARYEAAIAATFIRCGFKLMWNESKAVKGPEFIADHPATGDSLAVEVKSRHRPGVLHVRGDATDPEAVPATIEGLFADALRQNPGDRAFAVFIDVNLPPQTPLADGRPRWALDVEKIVSRYQQNPDAVAPFALLGVTNQLWHYQRGDEVARQQQSVLFAPSHSTHEIKRSETFFALLRALEQRGGIPGFE
jgi:hypothetical protein